MFNKGCINAINCDVGSGHPGAEQGSKGATVLCIMTYVNWV